MLKHHYSSVHINELASNTLGERIPRREKRGARLLTTYD
jgi:hypothetical protein